MQQDYEVTNALKWDLQLRKKLADEAKARAENPQEEPIAGSRHDQDIRIDDRSYAPRQHDLHQPRQHATRPKYRPPPKPRSLLPQSQAPQHDTSPNDENRSRRPVPNLSLDPDNAGQQAWRAREAAKESVRIPEALALQDQTHEEIAREHDTFLFSGEDSHSAGQVITFGIWGEQEAVEATKLALLDWIRDWQHEIEPSRGSNRSNRPSKFAKIRSLTPELRAKLERKWRRDQRLKCYRQKPSAGMGFEAIGSFQWPLDEYRPDEVFGMSYEALDPIRRDSECYIVFNDEKSAFEIMGKQVNVRAALDHLRKAFFQVAARQINPVRIYCLHWNDPDAGLPSHVHLHDPEPLNIVSDGGDNNTQNTTAKAPRACFMGDDTVSVESKTAESEAEVKRTVLQTLKKIHYYRGNIEMRVRLGTFHATQFKHPPSDGLYDLKGYESMLQESAFKGRVTHELGDLKIEKVAFDTLMKGTDLLQPKDAMIEKLAHVKPVYSAIFTFADQAGDLRLTISWREIEASSGRRPEYEPVSKKWSRLERDSDTPSPIYDASLTDLHTGRAWHFSIEAAQLVEEHRIPTALQTLAQNIHIDRKALQASGPTSTKFIRHHNPPFGVAIKHVQQRCTYPYTILSPHGRATTYTLELSCFQDSVYPSSVVAGTLFAKRARRPVVMEPRWGVSVFESGWDLSFAKNAALKIGQGVDWVHDVDDWFPPEVGMASGGMDGGENHSDKRCEYERDGHDEASQEGDGEAIDEPENVKGKEDDDESHEGDNHDAESDEPATDAQGFSQLMNMLKRVGQVLNTAAAAEEGDEDLVNGMTVG